MWSRGGAEMSFRVEGMVVIFAVYAALREAFGVAGGVSESGIGFEWQKSLSSNISAPRASDGVTPSFRRSESERANWRSKRAS
jgi:hypothetical protein